MNSRDSSDDGMRAAFRARLDAAPEPSDAMFARTMAEVAALPGEPVPRAPGWKSAARWWSALAAPARFATAAAIVIIGGTIAFGTVKATHDRVVAADSAPATRITLDRSVGSGPHLARSGSMQMAVLDVALAVRRIRTLVHHERGEILTQNGVGSPRAAHPATRLMLRVPERSLAATMEVIATLGVVQSRSLGTTDLTRELDDATARLRQAQNTARTLRSAARAGDDTRLPALEAEIARLRARRGTLEQRIATATLAIVLSAADAHRTAFVKTPLERLEPWSRAVRQTSILLARGSSLASHRSKVARRRLRAFNPLASGTLADRSRAGRAATGRNDATDRF